MASKKYNFSLLSFYFTSRTFILHIGRTSNSFYDAPLSLSGHQQNLQIIGLFPPQVFEVHRDWSLQCQTLSSQIRQ